MQQRTSGFDKDASGVTQFRNATERSSRNKNIITLCLTAIFLSFGLFACSFAPGCGSTSLNSSCTLPTTPTVVSSTTTTGLKRSTPAATPTVQPTATPTVGGSSSTALTPLTDEEQVTNDVKHYEDLVFKKDFNKAYNLLDVSVRDKVTYDAFINNASYILDNQCWQESKLTVTQRADQTWDVSIPMAQVSCANGSVQVTYTWHFTVWMIDNLPEIMSVGLYPTGTGN